MPAMGIRAKIKKCVALTLEAEHGRWRKYWLSPGWHFDRCLSSSCASWSLCPCSVLTSDAISPSAAIARSAIMRGIARCVADFRTRTRGSAKPQQEAPTRGLHRQVSSFAKKLKNNFAGMEPRSRAGIIQASPSDHPPRSQNTQSDYPPSIAPCIRKRAAPPSLPFFVFTCRHSFEIFAPWSLAMKRLRACSWSRGSTGLIDIDASI